MPPALTTTSAIVGFVSFAITIFIFLKSFWDAFTTVAKAPTQLRDSLTNLRYELYEEREYLKSVRKMHHVDARRIKANRITVHGETLKAITQTVKDLTREFKQLEAPFLADATNQRRKATTESDWDLSHHHPAKPYYRCDLGHRIIWLNSKSAVQDLTQQLQHLQIRRIANEVTRTHLLMNAADRTLHSLDNRVWAIEERLRGFRVVPQPRDEYDQR